MADQLVSGRNTQHAMIQLARRCAMAVVASLSFAALLSGCDNAADADESTKVTAKVTDAAGATTSLPLLVEPATLDFGPMEKGVTKKATVTLTNLTDEPITVLKATTSCGCTVADVPEAPIPPGGKTEVSISLKAKGKAGRPMTRSVKFLLEDGETVIPLTVRAKVIQLMTFSPPRFEYHLDQDQPVTLSSNDDRAFRVLGVQPPILDGVTSKSAEQHALVLSVEKWKAHGEPRSVRLTLDHPDKTVVDLKSEWPTPRKRPKPPDRRIKPHNDLVSLGDLRAGDTIRKLVLWRNVPEAEGYAPTVALDTPGVSVSIVEYRRALHSGLMTTLEFRIDEVRTGLYQATCHLTLGAVGGEVRVEGSIIDG